MSASRWPHGGDVRTLSQAVGGGDLLDFSANINPLGLPDWTRRVVSASVSSLAHYPDPYCTELIDAAAEHYEVRREELVAGNGSTELLYVLARVLNVRRAIVVVPCYRDYRAATEAAGITVETVSLRESDGFALDFSALEPALARGPEATVVILGQPNNPTGRAFDAVQLRDVAVRYPSAWFIVDEAFADFVEGLPRLTSARPSNVIVLLSLTKNYAIPGLRLGLAVAPAEIAARIRAALPPWSVNTLAQTIGAAALRDREYLAHSRKQVTEWREQLSAWFARTPGLRVYSGSANFLLVGIERSDFTARTLAERLLRQGIAIRVCDNFEGLDERYFRVAVRTEVENMRLIHALHAELSGAPAIVERRSTPAIMFQGTCSNAGKSVLAAGLCRVLLQDGFHVAPFKAQNMSLNSYVTRDGLEMGRAQVVQAQACRLEPDVRMNPILLKPNSDTGSQIVLRGRPIGNMEALDYFRYKTYAFEQVRSCYDSLAAECDAVVLEGAGSPAEVNLKSHDIVNMNMARHAAARVLLVGDIDRGGVFAAFVGCMEVFTEAERAQVAGFVVNKFRGKQSLLGDANDYILAHTGKPVLGVVPYLRDLGLPEEDSVGFKQGVFDDCAATRDQVDIAVIDLPHISNFTDFDALRAEPDVRLRVVRTPGELRSPSVVILPGSKNVPGDLRFLSETGLAAAIKQLAADGRSEIVGICGGYQMLGERIEDPHRLESDGTTEAALGLLRVSTTLEREKTLTRTTAQHIDSGLDVVGYEIHHGQTTTGTSGEVLRGANAEPMGARSANGLVWGCYLHGIFDADAFRRWYIDRLRVRRDLAPLERVLVRYDIEPALDRLADTLRACLPIERIYRLMGLR